jgi:Protein of unknown function (DUF3887)
MVEAGGPASCGACGRPLPPQRGKGRRQRYCDATCRSAARRRREAAGRREAMGQREAGGGAGVKEKLTPAGRHDSLDTVDPLAGVLARAGHGPPLEALAAARDLSAAAAEAMQQAVDRARAAGHSWREIGDVLGTTRQAAFQRFGHPVDPRTGTPMSTKILDGAAERAVAIFVCITEGRWEEARRDLNAKMREGLDARRLADGWARMAGLVGAYEGMGEPFAHRVADHTAVEIPLRFEAGEATGRVIFDEDGKVAGLWLRP